MFTPRVSALAGCDNTEDQPNVETSSKHDWFKKPERHPTPYPDWNVRKQIDFRPPQTWISQIAKAEKPHLSFDELISTPIDFSKFVMNHLKIDNLRQQHLVGPTFNLLKGTCKSRVELEYHFEECYRAITDHLDWTNPEDKHYKFCDGTLTFVRRVLHDIASSLEMEYLQKRTWSKLDRKRSRIMIKAIDQQLFERRLIRNLEKFVGGREYGNDFRLLEWTI
ncbi:hypothetical protein Tco_1142665 [Tanacetum coccineum]